jgi:hypothetical protein
MLKICFVFKIKALFSGSPKFFLSKKKKSGQKVLSGLVKYMSVDQKEPSIDIYKT